MDSDIAKLDESQMKELKKIEEQLGVILIAYSKNN